VVAVVVTTNAMDAANLVIWRATAPKVRCDSVFHDEAYTPVSVCQTRPLPPQVVAMISATGVARPVTRRVIAPRVILARRVAGMKRLAMGVGRPAIWCVIAPRGTPAPVAGIVGRSGGNVRPPATPRTHAMSRVGMGVTARPASLQCW
jgi:hypothetical protein